MTARRARRWGRTEALPHLRFPSILETSGRGDPYGVVVGVGQLDPSVSL